MPSLVLSFHSCLWPPEPLGALCPCCFVPAAQCASFMMTSHSIFQRFRYFLVAVARVRGRDVGGGHRGGARRRRGGSRFLVATGAGFRSRVTSAAARCAATASTGEICLGQPSLGQNELSSARGAAQVCGRVCTLKDRFSEALGDLRGLRGPRTPRQSLALGADLHPLGSGSSCVPLLSSCGRGDLELDSRQETKPVPLPFVL